MMPAIMVVMRTVPFIFVSFAFRTTNIQKNKGKSK
jgi:hypothetical protein